MQEFLNDATDKVECGSPRTKDNSGLKMRNTFKESSVTSSTIVGTPLIDAGKKRHRSRIRDKRTSDADEELVRLSFLEKKIAERGRFRDLEKTIERVQTFKTPHRRGDSQKTKTAERALSQRSNSSVV